MKKTICKILLLSLVLCICFSFATMISLAAGTDASASNSTSFLEQEILPGISTLLLIIGVAAIIILIVVIVVILKVVKGGKSKSNLGPFTTPQVQVSVMTPEAKASEKKAPIDPVNNVTENKGIPANIPQSASAFAEASKAAMQEDSIIEDPSKQAYVAAPEPPAMPSLGQEAPAAPEMPSLGQEAPAAPEMPSLGQEAPAAPEMPSLGQEAPAAPEMPSMEQAQPAAPVAPAAPATPAPQASAHVCPKCGAPINIRTATNGPMAGQKLAVCSNYPNCKFMSKIG